MNQLRNWRIRARQQPGSRGTHARQLTCEYVPLILAVVIHVNTFLKTLVT
jgi:hypothetical protein